MPEKKKKVNLIKRIFHEEWFTCSNCGKSTRLKKEITLKMPYCGNCDMVIHDSNQKYCGYCGCELEWK